MNINTQKKQVDKSQKEVFTFLSDVKNFESLMPDNIAKFEVLGDDIFVFGLKGMPEIKLKMKQKNEFNQIVLGAASDKLPFTLTANIESITENSCEVHLVFDGEFNAMMAMMIKTPITNFIETLVSKI
jgi:carbon monoxide dehydrogenase subunit G